MKLLSTFSLASLSSIYALSSDYQTVTVPQQYNEAIESVLADENTDIANANGLTIVATAPIGRSTQQPGTQIKGKNALPALFEAANQAEIKSAQQGLKPRFGLVFNLPVINNYGCWCHGGEYWPGAADKTGFGEVKDVYDDACKAHHMGFDCITLDAAAEGETCIPNETEYTLLVRPQKNGDYTLECADDIETDWCKRRTCLVDIRFIARNWKLQGDGIGPDYAAYGHPGYHDNAGNFDHAGECVVDRKTGNGNGNHQPIVKVCCGDYPYRIWYNKNNNKGIECCAYDDSAVIADYGFYLQVGQLYNSMSQTCCADRVITGSNVC